MSNPLHGDPSEWLLSPLAAGQDTPIENRSGLGAVGDDRRGPAQSQTKPCLPYLIRSQETPAASHDAWRSQDDQNQGVDRRGPSSADLDRAWAEAGQAVGRALRLTFEADGPSEPSGMLPTQGSALDPPLTLSVTEAAAVLGISRGSAYELVRRGSLRSLRLGRRILIPRAAICALLAQGPAPQTVTSECTS